MLLFFSDLSLKGFPSSGSWKLSQEQRIVLLVLGCHLCELFLRCKLLLQLYGCHSQCIFMSKLSNASGIIPQEDE